MLLLHALERRTVRTAYIISINKPLENTWLDCCFSGDVAIVCCSHGAEKSLLFILDD